MIGGNATRGAARARWAWAACFVLTLPLVNPYVRGDGNGYYAYVASAVVDRDLDFENEFRRGDPLFRSLYFDENGALRPEMRSETGRVVNQWAVGPALLWLPFVLVAHALAAALNVLGAGVAADGYSPIYRWLCAAGTAVYGALALAMAGGVAAKLAGRRAAAVGVVGVWWASSLPVYMYFLPFHVHALSAFAVALYLWCWLRWRPLGEGAARWAAWGALGGLMVDVYYLNVLFLLAAGVEWVALARRARGASLAGGVAFVAGLGAALAPHFAVKWIVLGSPFATGYLDRFFWTTPRLWQVGLSSEHGLFLWTPVAAAAVWGLFLWWRTDRAAAGTILATFVVFYYTVASYQNWHGQSSFGSRFFVSFTPAFVVGLALAAGRLDRIAGASRVGRAVAPALVALAVAWNVGFMYQWGANIVPNRGPVAFTTVASNQVTVVPRRLGRFAWRYLTDRAGLAADVEQRDRTERQNYELKR